MKNWINWKKARDVYQGVKDTSVAAVGMFRPEGAPLSEDEKVYLAKADACKTVRKATDALSKALDDLRGTVKSELKKATKVRYPIEVERIEDTFLKLQMDFDTLKQEFDNRLDAFQKRHISREVYPEPESEEEQVDKANAKS